MDSAAAALLVIPLNKRSISTNLFVYLFVRWMFSLSDWTLKDKLTFKSLKLMIPKSKRLNLAIGAQCSRKRQRIKESLFKESLSLRFFVSTKLLNKIQHQLNSSIKALLKTLIVTISSQHILRVRWMLTGQSVVVSCEVKSSLMILKLLSWTLELVRWLTDWKSLSEYS